MGHGERLKIRHLDRPIRAIHSAVTFDRNASDFGIWIVMNSDGAMRDDVLVGYRIIDGKVISAGEVYLMASARFCDNKVSFGYFSKLQKRSLYLINGYRIAEGLAHRFDGA